MVRRINGARGAVAEGAPTINPPHWIDTLIEIARTAPECGGALRARKCCRLPARTLAKGVHAVNQPKLIIGSPFENGFAD